MPFIDTAFIGGNGLNINHYTAIRLRVTGLGNLQQTLFSYDEINSDPQAALAMSPTNSIAPTVLANFTEMKAKLRIETTAIDEIFNISQIVIYVRQTATAFPQ